MSDVKVIVIAISLVAIVLIISLTKVPEDFVLYNDLDGTQHLTQETQE